MKILACDTSTKFLCLAVYDKGKVCGYRIEAHRRLSSLMAVSLERVVKAAGYTFADFDYFACGIGPGSFTGMRIGLAAFKALAWSMRKPLVGVSSLDVIAQGAPVGEGRIIPVVDAKRGLVYCSVFLRRQGAVKRLRRYMLIRPDEVAALAKKTSVILGDGVAAYGSLFARTLPAVGLMEKDYWYPEPQHLITRARVQIAEGKVSTAYRMEPLYLYPKECQIRTHHRK